jgi:hypothetical protein
MIRVLIAFCLLVAIDQLTRAWMVKRRRAGLQTSALDITGQPFPDIRRGVAPPERYQRDEGDENQDIATEGLGEDSWPGIDAINAVRTANPKLTDVHAYAVAKARKRLAAHR